MRHVLVARAAQGRAPEELVILRDRLAAPEDAWHAEVALAGAFAARGDLANELSRVRAPRKLLEDRREAYEALLAKTSQAYDDYAAIGRGHRSAAAQSSSLPES